MAKDPAKKYSVMTEMRKLFTKPKKMTGAGPRRDSKLEKAEKAALGMKDK